MDFSMEQAQEVLNKGIEEAESVISSPSKVDEILLQLEEKVIYLIKKKDLISDSIPIIGHADDLAVMGLALKLSEKELKAYAEWRDAQVGGTVL